MSFLVGHARREYVTKLLPVPWSELEDAAQTVPLLASDAPLCVTGCAFVLNAGFRFIDTVHRDWAARTQ